MNRKERSSPTSSGSSLRVRYGWVSLDQALSSLSNFGIAVLVARTSTPREFGAFSVVFAIYLVLLNIGRGLGSEPLLVANARSSDPARLAERSVVPMVALGFGLLSGVILALVMVFVGSPTSSHGFVLAASMPGLMLQDSQRFVSISNLKPSYAAVNDGLWIVVFLTVASSMWIGGADSGLGLFGAWGIGAGVAGLVTTATQPGRLSLQAAVTWLREQASLAWRFALELSIEMIAIQGSFIVVAALVSLEGAGAVNGARTLLAPLNVIFIGTATWIVAEGGREFESKRRGPPATLNLFGAALVGVALSWAIVLALIPDSLGRALLGRSWNAASELFLPMGVYFAALGFSRSRLAGLRLLADARTSLIARALGAPPFVIAVASGSILSGSKGAAAGFAFAAVGAAAIWSIQFARASAAHAGRNRPGEAET